MMPSCCVNSDITKQANWGYNQECNKYYRIKKNEIDYYRIGDKLGSGGTAEVYALVPENSLKKIKAIKISNPNPCFIGSSVFKFEREFKEFKILQTLPSSEGVQKRAKAFFTSEAQTGIIMPKYDGTLYDLHSKMNPAMILEAMRQLILGLDALHNQGIYTIDIKLDNIFFLSRKEKTNYVLADYGISVENKDFGIHFGIQNLGKAFKHMIFYWDMYKMNQITKEDMQKKGLPDSVAELINYMIDSTSKDMQIVHKLFSSCTAGLI